jgi:tRNA pseudouridine38-40 synthase
MSCRLKLIISYDGTSFGGWQSQTSRNTIQDRLEVAFRQILCQSVRVHGAGRTDAGVHAMAQCAHVDLPKKKYEAERWTAALNGVLPSSIRVVRCQFVAETFHARFSAKGKIYRYRIWNAAVLSPFEVGRAWHVISPLDPDTMVRAAEQFRGQHDFFSFSANHGSPGSDTIRAIRIVKVRQVGACFSIDFEGEGFLYKMVRMMVGAIVQVSAGKRSLREIGLRLASPQNVDAHARATAPPEGLYLVRVRY